MKVLLWILFLILMVTLSDGKVKRERVTRTNMGSLYDPIWEVGSADQPSALPEKKR